MNTFYFMNELYLPSLTNISFPPKHNLIAKTTNFGGHNLRRYLLLVPPSHGKKTRNITAKYLAKIESPPHFVGFTVQ